MIDPQKLHALVDGELDAAEEAALRREISESPECAAELQSIRAIKDVLATKTMAVPCEETWRRCVGRLGEIDKTRRIEGFVGRYAWGLCGVFFLFIAVGGMLTRNAASGTLRTGDVARVSASLTPFGAPPSNEPEVVDRWLDRSVGFSPRLGGGQIQVVSGATGSINGRPVCRLGLRDSQGPAALFIVRGVQFDGAPAGRFTLGKLNDVNCVIWNQNGFAMLLVADRSPEQLGSLAETVAAP